MRSWATKTLLISALLTSPSVWTAGSAHAQTLPEARRVAVVVGSNAAPPGRRALRYAADDARAVGAVLVDVGGFAREDVDVLVEPSPDAVLSALRRRMAQLAGVPGDTLIVFHYAGHADAQGLFPSGRLLSYDDLRAALSGPGATVRIGVVDACRGGGWTGTRGFTETTPFEVEMPMDLANEGTVLVASSSGLEDAHESETIHGGFFTHHWVAALRGAAEQSGDGIVSLTEAFEYAKRLTVRDSAATGADPQHPSFHMNLVGRADVPLSRVASADSGLTIVQEEGPIQLIHLDAGLLVLELPAGPRTAHLSLLPGRYLVRVRRPSSTLVTEIVLRADGSMTVREVDLVSVDGRSSVARGDTPLVSAASTPAGVWDLRFALGVRYDRGIDFDGEGHLIEGHLRPMLDGLGSISHGVGRRAYWRAPLVFGVRLGVPGRTAFVPWAGMLAVPFLTRANFLDYLNVQGGFGLWTETPLGLESTLITDLAFFAEYVSFDGNALSAAFTQMRYYYQGGAALRYSTGRMEIALGVGVYGVVVSPDDAPTRAFAPSLTFGSLRRERREVPLVRFHLTRNLALDAYVFLTRNMHKQRWSNSFLLGFSAAWPGAITRRRQRLPD